MKSARDGGAAAVEFALVALLLITMLVGIMEFGRAWATQASLAQAAREAARETAVHIDKTDHIARGVTHFNEVFWPFGAPDPVLTNADINLVVVGTPGDSECRVQASPTYVLGSLTGFFGSITVTGKGVMRCGG